MKRFLQDFEAMVSARAHDEFSRVRSLAQSLIERLTQQAEDAEGDLLAEIDRVKTGAAGLVTDIDAASEAAENLTLAQVRELHNRAQDIGLV